MTDSYKTAGDTMHTSIVTGTPTIFTAPKYQCPVHGVITQTMDSTIVGHEGQWCLTCYVDWVAKNIPRVTKIED